MKRLPRLTVDALLSAALPDLLFIGAMLGSLFPDLDPLMLIHPEAG